MTNDRTSAMPTPPTPSTPPTAPAAPAAPSLDYAFSAEVEVGPVDDYGTTRAGHRRVVAILGGRVFGGPFEGDEAEVLPGGADWQVLHADGRTDIDTRYSARTASGALVHLRTRGMRVGPPDVLEALLRGEAVEPADYDFHLTVQLETSAPHLAHLQDRILVADASRSKHGVRYDAFALRSPDRASR